MKQKVVIVVTHSRENHHCLMSLFQLTNLTNCFSLASDGFLAEDFEWNLTNEGINESIDELAIALINK